MFWRVPATPRSAPFPWVKKVSGSCCFHEPRTGYEASVLTGAVTS